MVKLLATLLHLAELFIFVALSAYVEAHCPYLFISGRSIFAIA